MDVLLLLALGNKVGLVLGKAAADSTGLLGTHIKRLVLLVLVQLSNLLTLLLGHHGQDTGDGLTDMAAIGTKKNYESNVSTNKWPLVHLGDLVGSTRGDLLDTKRGKLLLEVSDLLGKLGQSLLAQLKSFDVGRLHK